MADPLLFQPVAAPFLVGFDGTFDISSAPTEYEHDPGKAPNLEALEAATEKLQKLQHRLYANDKFGVLLVFQALDAAGKDGTIRAVMSGVNPQGCQVHSFKVPSEEELDHDFLWRAWKNLPEQGNFGIWNRSHYEEVLVVRVHPEFLEAQKLARRPRALDELWRERYESIVDAERHWARNGYVVLKFFLHVSQKEQHKRFLERLNDPEAQWKFNKNDMSESKHWDEYMRAYEDALSATSKPWAPWYCIPADSKSFMRRTVAEIVVGTLSQLHLDFPSVSEGDRAELEKIRKELAAERNKH